MRSTPQRVDPKLEGQVSWSSMQGFADTQGSTKITRSARSDTAE